MRTVNTEGAPARRQSTNRPSETVSVETAFEQAGLLHTRGKLDHAEQVYRAILQYDRTHIGSLHNLGILCFQRGQYDDTIALTREVLRLRPDLALAHNTLAVALRHLGRLAEAEASCRDALRLQSHYAEAHNTLGDVLTAQRRWKKAEACYREALHLQPDYAEAHNNLGTVLTALNRLDEAESSCREALRLRPENVAALNNLATVLLGLGRPQEAEASCLEALAIRPDFVPAINNLSTVLIARRCPQEAEIFCRKALSLSPESAEAVQNLGIALSLQQKLIEAAACFENAVTLKPDDPDIRVGWFYMRQEICNWSSYREDEARVRNSLEGRASPGAAFRLLGCDSTLEQQLAYARRVADGTAVPGAAIFPRRPLRPDAPIRLGYFSANFHIHPIAHLIAGLIEHHDRRRFEVIGYGFDEDDGSPMRRRLIGAFDRFADIAEMQDRDAARLIHADTVDILIDLHGWTPDCRAKILACRPAPIQVNYLGYPGTSGADFIDYIILDRMVVPPQELCFFSEQAVYLPNCYQSNDDKREIVARAPSRAECGLPERGFVFCCFNNSWKLTPTFFDIWMRLLRAVPDSVLWLYEANPLMQGNLAREAAARGIAPERVVLAARMPQAEHLARHRLADLFLDTLPYNAHTTASDALWAGLPVLTCAGNTFAGRVAGSLLRAVGLDALVTSSLEEYEALALQLAGDRARLAKLRGRLAQNRHTFPLFDTARYTRHLEAAYWQMAEISGAGQPASAFSVEASGEISEVSRPEDQRVS
jgi:protein O-GlcNAc transferase